MSRHTNVVVLQHALYNQVFSVHNDTGERKKETFHALSKGRECLLENGVSRNDTVLA